MSEINVGDMVRMKSGGPNMMVTDVGEDYGGAKLATCEWFDDKKEPQEKSFAVTSLERVPPQPSASDLASRGPKVV